MKSFLASLCIVSISLLGISGCGGGGGSGDGASDTQTAVNSVTGFVAKGSPVRNAMIQASNGVVIVTATSDASGRYTLNNVSQFTFPLTIVATDPEQPELQLQTVVLQGQRVANITPATTALSKALALGQTTAPEILRISRLMQNALSNYIPGSAAVNFFSDAGFRPNSTGIDEVFDLVEFDFDGSSLVLTSKPNPALQVIVNPGQANPPVLGRPAANAMATPSVIATLVNTFDNAFRTGNMSVNNLRNALHDDFQDDQGLRIDHFAQVYNNPTLVSISGFEILRCFPDTSSVFDRCQIRLNFARPLTRFAEDFGNSNFTQLIRREFYDLEVERRGAQVNPLKFSGGYLNPFAGKAKLIQRNTQVVGANGFPLPNSVIESGVFIQAPASPPGLPPASFGELANSNIRAVDLVRSPQPLVSSVLFSVSRVQQGQCSEGTSILVAQPDPLGTGGEDCGNTRFGPSFNGLASSSKAGEIFMDVTQGLGQTNIVNRSRPVRIDAPKDVPLSDFPVLPAESLANLNTYANTPNLRTVVISLATPPGKQSVCISSGLEPEPICVYGQRRFSLAPEQLGKANSYLISSEDLFGNLIQRRYTFSTP